MKTSEETNDDLQAKYDELFKQYANSLQKDSEFEQVKKIYTQLQEIKRKLKELNNKAINNP